MTGKISPFSAADFQTGTRNLLPQGRAWPREQDVLQAPLLGAISDPLFALHTEAMTLLNTEANPATTALLLADWEADYGLPDPCTPLNPTLEQRHALLLGRIAAYGGQSPSYFIGVAAALGYAITITESLLPFRAGYSHAGDPVTVHDQWYTWTVNAPSITTLYFRAGLSVAGDPLTIASNTQLECVLTRLKPAHTALTFKYS